MNNHCCDEKVSDQKVAMTSGKEKAARAQPERKVIVYYEVSLSKRRHKIHSVFQFSIRHQLLFLEGTDETICHVPSRICLQFAFRSSPKICMPFSGSSSSILGFLFCFYLTRISSYTDTVHFQLSGQLLKFITQHTL